MKQIIKKLPAMLIVAALILSGARLYGSPKPVSATPTYACESRADLWFGNDESGSVSASEFDDALDFMYQISDKFAYNATTGVQAGAFAWDTSTNDVIIPITEDFADTDDTGLIQDSNVVTDSDTKGVRELYTAKAGGGGTDLTVATQHMADLIEGGNGRRAGVRQIAIILTDATESQLTTDGSNWIAAADTLRDAGEGNVGIVLVLIAEASDAYTGGSAGPTVDAVAGENGLIVTVPTYADAANATQGYIDQVADTICDAIDPTPADDGDNVSIPVEQASPNSGDGNNDGTDDSTQPSVTSFVNPVTNQYAVLDTSCTTNASTGAGPESTSNKDGSYDYPVGLMNFNLTGCPVGGTVTVTQYFYGDNDAAKFVARKYNDITHTYTDLPGATLSNVTIGGSKAMKIVYQLTDGSSLDQDGVANGTIIDPSGPAVLGATTLAPDTGLQMIAYPFYTVGLGSALVGRNPLDS